MRGLFIVLSIIVLVMTSCVKEQRTKTAEPAMNQEKKTGQQTAISLTQPKGLDDEWSRWLIGEWESSGESDLPGFKSWVKGNGRVKVELGVGGQFLVVTKEGEVVRISDEYVQHLRHSVHAPEEEIEKLRRMKFAEVEFFTTDPQTGGIIAYLFDSWRCVAAGAGRREGDKEIMEWKWSAGGQGTSVRTTERVGDDKLVVTERYTLADGGTMEDRVQMTRK